MHPRRPERTNRPGRTPRPRLEGLESRLLYSTTYYLAPGGNDANPGTLAAPWQTLQHAVKTVAAGDTVDLRAGTYTGGVTLNTPSVTLESYAGENATIAAPDNNGVNLDVDIHASGSSFKNLDVRGGLYAVKTESTYSGNNAGGIGASNLLFSGCTIHDSGQHLMKISPGCDHVTITHCELYNSGRDNASAGQAVDDVNGSYLVLEDSYIHDTTQNGVFVKGGSTGSIIQRNHFENIGYGAILLGQSTDYVWFNHQTNPNLYESIDCVARNNVIVNTQYAGISLWGSLRPHVYNNTIVNAARQGQGGIFIVGVGHSDDPNNSSQFTKTSGAQVANNLIVLSSSSPMIHIGGKATADATVFSHNRYFQTGGGQASFMDENGTFFQGNLAQWQAHSASDAGSSEGDPSLSATEQLTSGSACIDAGQTLADVTDDYNNNARPAGGGYDIGAFEFGAAPVTPPVVIPPPVPTPPPVITPPPVTTPPPVVTPPATTGTVTGFSFVLATTGAPVAGLQNLQNGAVISLRQLPKVGLNIATTVSGPMGSVKFVVNGVRKPTENAAPYAVFGMSHGKMVSWRPHTGTYTLTATPYTLASGRGTAGTPVTIKFKVVR